MTSLTVRPFSSSWAASSQTRMLPCLDAHHRDLADAGDGLELFLQTVLDVVADDPGREGAAQGDHQDGLVLGIGLGDDRRVDVPGQAAGGLGDLGLDVLKGEVDVPGEVELDRDVGRAHAARWR